MDSVELGLIKDNIKSYKIKLAYNLIKLNESKGIYLLEDMIYNDANFSDGSLALAYEEGRIVPKNLVKSYMYYDLMGGLLIEKIKND